MKEATTNAALKLALDLAIMHHSDDGYAELRLKVRQLAKEALAQDEQSSSQGPVAWEQFYPDIGKPQLGQEPFGYVWLDTANFRKKIPPTGESEAWNAVYTTPPQRPWVGLTDEQREECTQSPFTEDNYDDIEAKLKELNT